MPVGRYRITNATIAVFLEDGRHVAHTVPAGAIIAVDNVASVAFDGEHLINVIWETRKVMMFAQDLRTRAWPVD